MKPESMAPTTATGAARPSWPNGSVATMMACGGAERVAQTMTRASENSTEITSNGVALSISMRPIKSWPSARPTKVPTM